MKRNTEFDTIIKEYFISFKTVINSSVKKFCKDNPIISKYLDDWLDEYPEFGTKINIITSILKNLELSKCKICGKLMKFSLIRT